MASIYFSYQDLGTTGSQVTRQLDVIADQDYLSDYFTTFSVAQLLVGFDPDVVTVSNFQILPDDIGAVVDSDPETPAASSALGLLSVGGISQAGLSPGDNLLRISYSHSIGLDPEFTVSGLTLASFSRTLEDFSEQAIVSSFNSPNPDVEVIVDSPVVTSTVASILAEDSGYRLYKMADNTLAISDSLVSVGEVIELPDLLVLTAGGSAIDASVLSVSTLSDLSLSVLSSGFAVSLEYSTGVSQGVAFDATGNLVADSDSASDAEEQTTEDTTDTVVDDETSGEALVGGLSLDGVNTGSGVVDAAGIEITFDEVPSLFSVPSNSLAVFRQRLGDSVAFESLNIDGSMSGSLFGVSGSRTVGTLNTGELDYLVDIPSARNIDFMGKAGTASSFEATRYLNSLVDGALGTSTWGDSLKSAVAKAASNHVGENVGVSVISPNSTNGVSDEVVLASRDQGSEIAALNLLGTNDLISVGGVESLVLVGAGRVKAVGSESLQVYGDLMDQEVVGSSSGDYLFGGGGDDVFYGGAGSDVFAIGPAGTTYIGDLTAADSIEVVGLGISTMDQLLSRLVSVQPGATGINVQFDTFAIEFVGYNDLSRFASEVTFA